MTQPKVKTDIEARVMDTGDVMTGPLFLGNGRAKLNTNDIVLAFSLYNDINNPLEEYRQFRIVNSLDGSPIGYSLQILDKEKDKELNIYNIYHQGFKPSAADIGAISSNVMDRILLPNGSDFTTYFNNAPAINTYGSYYISGGDTVTGTPDDTRKVWWFFNKTPNGFFATNHINSDKLWYRYQCNKTYSNWYEIIHTGNFNQYALPISGGTLTGSLEFTQSNGLRTRHIDGEITTYEGSLYLNYWTHAPIYLGLGGNYYITADGLYYTGNCKCISGDINNTPALRWHALEFVSGGMTIGTGSGQCQPNSGTTSGVWYFPPEGTYFTSSAANVQVIRITWQPDIWVNELFFSPNSASFYHRSVQNGIAHPWRRIWEEGDSITSAVWNDYAEHRESNIIEPGYVLMEKGDDTLIPTEERLSHFYGISSDTWGFSQGETETAKTPIAVAGRVLAYTYEDRDTYSPGDCVCAAPGGTVSKMTRQEIIEWPDRIVGKVSYVPDYEIWGGGENADREPVKVDGRIWIQVK